MDIRMVGQMPKRRRQRRSIARISAPARAAAMATVAATKGVRDIALEALDQAFADSIKMRFRLAADEGKDAEGKAFENFKNNLPHLKDVYVRAREIVGGVF